MGGTVAWTIRLPDGVEHRMRRYTNDLPDLIANAAFLSADPQHLADCVRLWTDLHDDWTENNGCRAFRHRATADLAPYPMALGPKGYGLVVTDFVNGVILSNQHYSNLGSLSLTWIDYNSKGMWQTNFQERYERILAVIEAGMISSYEAVALCTPEAMAVTALGGSFEPHPQDAAYLKISIPGAILFSEVERFFLSLPRDPHRRFIVDTRAIIGAAPMSIEAFGETPQEWMRMKERVLDLGFVLTEADHVLWDECIFRSKISEDKDAAD
jgi:hypothetical protein